MDKIEEPKEVDYSGKIAVPIRTAYHTGSGKKPTCPHCGQLVRDLSKHIYRESSGKESCWAVPCAE